MRASEHVQGSKLASGCLESIPQVQLTRMELGPSGGSHAKKQRSIGLFMVGCTEDSIKLASNIHPAPADC